MKILQKDLESGMIYWNTIVNLRYKIRKLASSRIPISLVVGFSLFRWLEYFLIMNACKVWAGITWTCRPVYVRSLFWRYLTTLTVLLSFVLHNYINKTRCHHLFIISWFWPPIIRFYLSTDNFFILPDSY